MNQNTMHQVEAMAAEIRNLYERAQQLQDERYRLGQQLDRKERELRQLLQLPCDQDGPMLNVRPCF